VILAADFPHFRRKELTFPQAASGHLHVVCVNDAFAASALGIEGDIFKNRHGVSYGIGGKLPMMNTYTKHLPGGLSSLGGLLFFFHPLL
jgi:hypothetical protein